MRQRRQRGFTLVELLVVIGIIALLISVLMPALNQARSAAKLVQCSSNFKQIYNGLLMYSNTNKGILPFQSTTTGWGASGTNPVIFFEIGQAMGFQKVENTVWESEVPEIFRCTEGATSDEGAVWNIWVQRDVSWHPRAFPSYEVQGGTPLTVPEGSIPANIEYPQRKLASIRNGSSKIAFWENGQRSNWNLTVEPSSINLDGWHWSWGHMFQDPPRTDYNEMDKPVDTGPNREGTDFYPSDGSNMRFRHRNNKVGPFAFFDGHVEVRPLGGIIKREICISRHN